MWRSVRESDVHNLIAAGSRCSRCCAQQQCTGWASHARAVLRELSARPAHQTPTQRRRLTFPLLALRGTEKVEQGSAPQAVLTGHSIAQRGGASGMTGSGKWTPVKRDLVTVVARHVE